MNKPTLKEIVQVLGDNKFVIFNQPFSVNFGGIRTKDNTSNKFNDWLYAFYFNDKHELVGEIVPGTTDAGVYYREHPMNKNGTAIIQHNIQHRSCYQLQDPTKNKAHIGHNRQKAFRQIKPMKYWRDNDKDNVLEHGGVTFEEIGYTNCHYMGTVGNNVDKWSAGCCGATITELNKIFAICEVQVNKFRSDIFSFTLLHEELFD